MRWKIEDRRPEINTNLEIDISNLELETLDVKP